MTDIIPEVSVEPTTPYSLLDKRAEYADWLKSGREHGRPMHAKAFRSDEGPADPCLAARREQAHADSASKLLHELPPGYICRTDEGEGEGGTAGVSEEVRLKLAGALVDKMAGVDAETATRMANAGAALLGPLTARADDAKADAATIKNTVVADEKKDDNAPSLQGIMDAIGAIGARLDKLEGKGKDSEHTRIDPKDKDKKAADSDRDHMLAARTRIMRGNDAVRVDSLFREDATSAYHEGMNEVNQLPHVPETQDFFAAVQARADSVYSKLGKSAPRPMDGEKLGNYRRRLLVPLQGFCAPFKHTDLKVVAVDNASLEPVERAIYTAAADEAINPKSVPLGTLREIVETRGGHTYAKFYGNPKAWMSGFMPQGRRVKTIERNPGTAIYQRT